MPHFSPRNRRRANRPIGGRSVGDRSIGDRPLWDRLEPRQLFAAAAVATPVALLTAADVTTILGQAESQALRPTQAVAVVDRDGNVLGEYIPAALENGHVDAQYAIEIELDAILRARTAAFFESRGEAFTTRTARFIIQDHFPQDILNTPGGPLYGVQFSSGLGTDVLSPSAIDNIGAVSPAGISGDPGGIPLYKTVTDANGKAVRLPVGGVGVAGDFSDVAARKDLYIASAYQTAANPTARFYTGAENADLDESVALAGAVGYMAPASIRANNILLGGLRLPYVASPTAKGKPNLPLDIMLGAGDGILRYPVVASPGDAYPQATIGKFNQPGQYVRQDFRAYPTTGADPTDPDATYGVVASNDTVPGTTTPDPNDLTAADVNQIIAQAVEQADVTRAGIRRPIGVHAVVQVAVVDRDGDLLGVFRMQDATNFSYDVAVQKARTAAFFSDDTHAFSTRAIGFLSQRYIPSGISSGLEGPLYHLQNAFAFAGVSDDGKSAEDGSTIVDSTVTPIGTVAAAVADPTTSTVVVSGTTLTVGQIITFGEDTEHEYEVTAVSAAGATLKLDGIDTPVDPPQPLTVGEAVRPKNPLKDGVTIFPGGVPLYKNGELVGAIGISGDGVDQDDTIAYSGSRNFRPAAAIRSDALPSVLLPDYLADKVNTIEQTYSLASAFGLNEDFVEEARKRAQIALVQQKVRLPYTKVPRNSHA